MVTLGPRRGQRLWLGRGGRCSCRGALVPAQAGQVRLQESLEHFGGPGVTPGHPPQTLPAPKTLLPALGELAWNEEEPEARVKIPGAGSMSAIRIWDQISPNLSVCPRVQHFVQPRKFLPWFGCECMAWAARGEPGGSGVSPEVCGALRAPLKGHGRVWGLTRCGGTWAPS